MPPTDDLLIELSLVGGATYDVTHRLDDEGETKVGAVEKPSRIDRFMDDVTLLLHDEDLVLRGLFLGAGPTADWRVSITAGGKVIYRGKVRNEESYLDVEGETVELDTFSLESVLWDICKKTKIRPRLNPGEVGAVYTTFGAIIRRELSGMFRTENPFEGLFDGFDLGEYETDQVRFSKTSLYTTVAANTTYGQNYLEESGSPNWVGAGITTEQVVGCPVTAYLFFAPEQNVPPLPLVGHITEVDQTNKRIYVDAWAEYPYTGNTRPTDRYSAVIGIWPTIGVDGRYTRLDPETTVADFLEAATARKNAAFFIDFETRKFTMRRRLEPINDRATTEGLTVDDYLLQVPKPRIALLDDAAYDYVQLRIGAPQPPRPRFLSIEAYPGGIVSTGAIGYVVTLLFGNGYETNPSEELEIFHSIFEGGTARVTLALDPSYIPGVIARRIYRTDFNDPQRRHRLLAQVAGDLYVEHQDTTPFIYVPNDPNLIANTQYPPDESQSVGAWIKFDPATGNWAVPIININTSGNQPEGRIFTDTYSELKFLKAATSEEADNNEYQQTKMFVGEAFNEAMYNRFKRYFLVTRRMEIGLEGRGFRVGDTILAGQKLSPGDQADDRLVFRRANISISKQDETEATLVTV